MVVRLILQGDRVVQKGRVAEGDGVFVDLRRSGPQNCCKILLSRVPRGQRETEKILGQKKSSHMKRRVLLAARGRINARRLVVGPPCELRLSVAIKFNASVIGVWERN